MVDPAAMLALPAAAQNAERCRKPRGILRIATLRITGGRFDAVDAADAAPSSTAPTGSPQTGPEPEQADAADAYTRQQS